MNLSKIKISDQGIYFTYQYDALPMLFILKEDGKIYAKENNNMAQFEAFRLLRALVKFSLVKNYRRVQQSKRFRS